MRARPPASIACVAALVTRPMAAAVFDLAAVAGREPGRQRERIAGRTGLHRVGRFAAQALVDHAAERGHADDRQHAEQRPLSPVRQGRAEHALDADDDCREADEHEVELRIDECEFGAQQHCARDRPHPPVHVLVPPRRGRPRLKYAAPAPGRPPRRVREGAGPPNQAKAARLQALRRRRGAGRACAMPSGAPASVSNRPSGSPYTAALQ